MSRSEAVALARRAFPHFFGRRLWRGPALRTDERVRRYLGSHAAIVDPPQGSDFLLQSFGDPLTAPSESGETAPVDTVLERRGNELHPRNVPVPTRIPTEVRDGISFTRSEVAVMLAGARSSEAITEEDKAMYSNVFEDTDFAVAALPGGVQATFVLRSERAPEELPFAFDLPSGAELRPAQAAAGMSAGGAEIVRDGKPIAGIAPPAAFDADGQPVPVAYDVVGGSLIVRVDHRDRDLRAPIFVDPYVWEYYHFRDSGHAADRWGYHNDDAGFIGHNCSQNPYCASDTPDNNLYGRGLYVQMAFPRWYDLWKKGEWYWQAPRNSSIVRINWNNFGHRWYWTCVNGYIWGQYGAEGHINDCDGTPGVWSYATSCIDPYCGAHHRPGNWAVFNLQVHPYSIWAQDQAWAYLGNPQIGLWEGFPPTVHSLSSEPPQGWVENVSQAVQVRASDSGLGVKTAILESPSGSTESNFGCSGDRFTPCFEVPIWLPAVSYNTSTWPEGYQGLRFLAADVIGNRSQNDIQRTIKIDRTAPEVTPSGGLWRDRVHDEFPINLAKSSYDLRIVADDGDARSGVKSIEIQVDDLRKDYVEASCGESCPRTVTRDWTLRTDDYPDGDHAVTVIARDLLGHQTVKRWKVTIGRKGHIHDSVNQVDESEDATIAPGEEAPPDSTADYCEPDVTGETVDDCGPDDALNPQVITAENEPALDPELDSPLGAMSSSSAQGGVLTPLDPRNWGLSDDGHDFFNDSRFLRLGSGTRAGQGLRLARRSISWDVVTQGEVTPSHPPCPRHDDPNPVRRRDSFSASCASETERDEIDPTTGQEGALYALKEFLRRARCRGVEPLISFRESRDRPRDNPPSVPQYRAEMRKFRHRFAPRPDDIDPETGQPIPCTGFPHITYFTAWNEPNLGQLDDAGSTKLKMRLYPYRAGQFWHELNRLCKETEPATTDHPFVPTCGVAAGDFIDKKTSFREPIVDRDTGRRYESYFDAYNAGRRKRAKIWAYHAYNAAKRSNDSSLFREFLRRTCKCGGNDPYNSGPPVWLTEQGAFRYQSTMEPGEPRVDKLKRTPLQANADAEFLLRLPGIGRRIKRFYWYSWKGDLNFDTGLLNRKNERNPDGTPKDYIRRVYCTFGHTVNPDYDHDPATPGLQPCAPEEDDNSPPG